ncbi:TIGR03088 family PEP-CTERM/XrtA system glycosyltransferase [Nitrogeniibacter aestuarii]|uniref:TIGR03088 family PEP-CTERM/XrtA system glycosyltransferase n=1 Tax=Nitrogeniibacter aestuarii TaxID=2815343 RepID=UPI001D12F1BF|nr:TIGR03088 family PEP-CTERM/XrtA system glycosyltransferase [Nitrogeniibacter aestuarii]
MTQLDATPLVAHVLYNFDIGGLENGVVNLINQMPPDRYRHVVIALAQCEPSFCQRVTRPDVEFISIHKPPGNGFRIFGRLFREFRRLRPAIVHTRNLAALEMTVPAKLAGVSARIHGEHGWDNSDPDGQSRKYRLIRRMYAPFVTHYIALSSHISRYLTQGVGIRSRRITRICNGVDASRFSPGPKVVPDQAPAGFFDTTGVVFGTVGRLQSVKDQMALLRAVAQWRATGSEHADAARIVIVGDGPMRKALEDYASEQHIAQCVWFAGARDNVPELMRSMDVFVLPSLAEGISNTLLEAMATGLPVIATAVGGNTELVDDGITGHLVAPGAPEQWVAVLEAMAGDPGQRTVMSVSARQRVEAHFSLDAMVKNYMAVYDDALGVSRDTVETVNKGI